MTDVWDLVHRIVSSEPYMPRTTCVPMDTGLIPWFKFFELAGFLFFTFGIPMTMWLFQKVYFPNKAGFKFAKWVQPVWNGYILFIVWCGIYHFFNWLAIQQAYYGLMLLSLMAMVGVAGYTFTRLVIILPRIAAWFAEIKKAVDFYSLHGHKDIDEIERIADNNPLVLEESST